ncbi:MAG: YceI family protein [Candidatus Acidiferrum sp.]
MKQKRIRLRCLKMAIVCFPILALLSPVNRAQTSAGVPVYEIRPVESAIKFNVQASVPITGKFDNWNATLTFASADLATGVLDINIQATSVDTGSSMKNSKLKGKISSTSNTIR